MKLLAVKWEQISYPQLTAEGGTINFCVNIASSIATLIIPKDDF